MRVHHRQRVQLPPVRHPELTLVINSIPATIRAPTEARPKHPSSLAPVQPFNIASGRLECILSPHVVSMRLSFPDSAIARLDRSDDVSGKGTISAGIRTAVSRYPCQTSRGTSGKPGNALSTTPSRHFRKHFNLEFS